MGYYDESELRSLGFKHIGKDVKISRAAYIYNHELISIGDHSRVDDLCILSGNISIGPFCHITPMCLFAGGIPGIEVEAFSTFAYGVKVFSQSDDYSGVSMTNSLIPKKYKKEIFSRVKICKHVIVGSGATVFPGVVIGEGCSVGAMSLVNKSLEPWGIYVGIPAVKLKDREKGLLALEEQFLKEIRYDSI